MMVRRFPGWLLSLALFMGFSEGQDNFTLAEAAGAQAGLPPMLMTALVMAESSGDARAVSPSGAIGLTQLMPATAADLGINPYDPWQNLQGGSRYLAQQLRRFKTIPLALAAYNAGPGNVQAYGGIPPFTETQNYVVRVMNLYAMYSGQSGLPQTTAALRQSLPQVQTTTITTALLSTPVATSSGAVFAPPPQLIRHLSVLPAQVLDVQVEGATQAVTPPRSAPRQVKPEVPATTTGTVTAPQAPVGRLVLTQEGRK